MELMRTRQAGQPRYDYAVATLRDGRRIVNEVREIVPMDFVLNRGEQIRLLHSVTPGREEWG